MTRIHILGASGSGVSTLGEALARRLKIAHVDADDVYWLHTNPPFVEPRPEPDRHVMLAEVLPETGCWVFSGSAMRWGEPAEPLYDLVVFLSLDPVERMARLLSRERRRYGARIEPGGDMHLKSCAFLAWAKAYDTAGLGQRSRATHEAWLDLGLWPVLRLDSAAPVDDLVDAVVEVTSRRHPDLVRRASVSPRA